MTVPCLGELNERSIIGSAVFLTWVFCEHKALKAIPCCGIQHALGFFKLLRMRVTVYLLVNTQVAPFSSCECCCPEHEDANISLSPCVSFFVVYSQKWAYFTTFESSKCSPAFVFSWITSSSLRTTIMLFTKNIYVLKLHIYFLEAQSLHWLNQCLPKCFLWLVWQERILLNK